MEIKLILKTVYGEKRYYPACGNAKIFTDMLRMKTLTPSAISFIRELGYDVTFVHEAIEI